MRYVLGVDGGNTKTIALIAAEDGSLLGIGHSACTDIYNVGPEKALEGLELAISSALAQASITPEQLTTGVFSQAGADWPEDYEFLHNEFTKRCWGQKIDVYNDAIGALRAGSPDGTGVSVVCGTGSAVGARTADGRFWHTSFWQAEASGAWDLGMVTFRAVLRAELGIAPPSSLTQRFLDFYQVASVEEGLHQITRRGGHGYEKLRLLTPLIVEEAERGDEIARHALRTFGTTVADYALVAIRRFEFQNTTFPLVLAGGVMRSSPRVLADAITARVHEFAPGARPVFARYQPVVGAVLLALEAAGINITENVTTRLEATMPQALTITP